MHNRVKQGQSVLNLWVIFMHSKKGEAGVGMIAVIVLAMIIILVFISISGHYGDQAEQASPIDSSKEDLECQMLLTKCSTACTHYCIDDSYAVPAECQECNYIEECCDCDGVTDIVEGCDSCC